MTHLASFKISPEQIRGKTYINYLIVNVSLLMVNSSWLMINPFLHNDPFWSPPQKKHQKTFDFLFSGVSKATIWKKTINTKPNLVVKWQFPHLQLQRVF